MPATLKRMGSSMVRSYNFGMAEHPEAWGHNNNIQIMCLRVAADPAVTPEQKTDINSLASAVDSALKGLVYPS